VTFPINTKRGDTLTVSFPVIENALISFGVGMRYTDAEGFDSLMSRAPSESKLMIDPSD